MAIRLGRPLVFYEPKLQKTVQLYSAYVNVFCPEQYLRKKNKDQNEIRKYEHS